MTFSYYYCCGHWSAVVTWGISTCKRASQPCGKGERVSTVTYNERGDTTLVTGRTRRKGAGGRSRKRYTVVQVTNSKSGVR